MAIVNLIPYSGPASKPSYAIQVDFATTKQGNAIAQAKSAGSNVGGYVNKAGAGSGSSGSVSGIGEGVDALKAFLAATGEDNGAGVEDGSAGGGTDDNSYTQDSNNGYDPTNSSTGEELVA